MSDAFVPYTLDSVEPVVGEEIKSANVQSSDFIPYSVDKVEPLGKSVMEGLDTQQVHKVPLAPSHESPSVSKTDWMFTHTPIADPAINPGTINQMSKLGYGPKPSGGWDEAGNPVVDNRSEPYTDTIKEIKDVANTAKGLFVKDGKANVSELIHGAGQFAKIIPGAAIGSVMSIQSGAKSLMDQVTGRPEDFNLETVFNEFARGFHEGMGMMQPIVDAADKKLGGLVGADNLTGEVTKESELVGRGIMLPFEIFSAGSKQLAEDPVFRDYPNIRGGIKLMGALAGLAYNKPWVEGLVKAPKYSKNMIFDINEALKDPLKEALDIYNEASGMNGGGRAGGVKTDTVKTPLGDLPGPEDLAAQKVREIKLKQLDIQMAKIAKGIAGEELINEELGRKIETASKNRVYPLRDASPEMTAYRDNMPKKKDIEKVLGEIPNEEDSSIIKPTEEIVTNALPQPGRVWPANRVDGVIYPGKPGDLHAEIAIKSGHIKDPKAIDMGDINDKYKNIEGGWIDHEGNFLTSEEASKYTRKYREEVKPNGLQEEGKTEGEVKSEVGTTGEVPSEAPVVPEKKGRRKKVTTQEPPPPIEPITKVDESVGIEAKDNYGERSPFISDVEKTQTLKKLYDERPTSLRTSIDSATGKLVNDVNLWLQGDDSIDIDVTRNVLSRFAKDADMLRDHFDSLDKHLKWKEFVSDAATWARRTERLKIEQSSIDTPVRSKSKRSGGVRFNSMIPVDQFKIPEAVKKWFGGTGVRFAELRRNRKLFEDTGYWWNHDKRKFMWEYSDHEGSISEAGSEKLLNGQQPLLHELWVDPKLYDHVPELKGIKVDLSDNGKTYYDPNTKEIRIGLSEIGNEKKAVLHETAHGIQDFLKGSAGGSIEQFLTQQKNELFKKVTPYIKDANAQKEVLSAMQSGYDLYTISDSRPELFDRIDLVKSILETPLDEGKAYQDYLKLTGEMEARLTEYRADMTPSERRAKPPWVSLNEMLKEENLPVSAGYKLYSDPFFLQAMSDFVKKKFGNKSSGLTKEDINSIEDQKIRDGLLKGKAFSDSTDADKRASLQLKKTTLKEAYDLTASALWDTQSRVRATLKAWQGSGRKDLKQAASYAMQHLINVNGGHAAGHRAHEQFIKEVCGDLNSNQRDTLFKLIRGQRIQDIASYKPDVVFPKGQGFEEAIYYETNVEVLSGLSKGEIDLLKQRREHYFNGMRELVDMLQEGGILSEDAAVKLKSHDYSMFKGIGKYADGHDSFTVESLVDERVNTRLGGKVQSVTASGIDNLKKGTATDILEFDQRIVALEMFNRVYGRVFKNRVFQDLAEIARSKQDNGFIRLGEIEEKITKEKREAAGEEVDKLPAHDTKNFMKHYFWEGGQKKAVYLEHSFADAMGSAGRDISPRGVLAAKLISMSTPLKVMATGISPLWSTFVNFPIDQLTVYLTNGVYENGKRKRIYSTNPVVAGLQMGSDLGATFYDTFFRALNTRDRMQYMRTAERGLQMPFMTTQARLSRKGYKLPGFWSKLEDFVGYHSTSMELWTRHAIVNRIVKRRAAEQGISMSDAWKDNKILDEAVAGARDYLDFSQGGWLVKMMDQLGMVYLNAGVQAQRAYVRAFKENPTGTAMAVMQSLGAATVGITVASVLNNSKTYREIPKYQEDNNLNVPLPDSWRFKDSEGTEYGMYISLPIGSFAGMMKNVFQAGTIKALKESGYTDRESDWESIGRSFKQAAPDIMTVAPSARALIQYAMNKDLRTGRDITPKVFNYPDSKNEFTPGKTPQMAIDFGQITGMSPDRVNSVKDSILANNEWTALLGYGYEKQFGDIPKDIQDEHRALSLAKISGFKRIFKLTKSDGEISDKQREIKSQNELERWVDQKNVNYYAKLAYWHNSKEGDDKLYDYIHRPEVTGNEDKRKRLFDQADFIRKIRNLEDKSGWLSMYHEPAEVRAKDYLLRESVARTPEEKDKLQRQLGVVLSSGNYASESFWRNVGSLRSKGWSPLTDH